MAERLGRVEVSLLKAVEQSEHTWVTFLGRGPETKAAENMYYRGLVDLRMGIDKLYMTMCITDAGRAALEAHDE